jgi:hypothetical protein
MDQGTRGIVDMLLLVGAMALFVAGYLFLPQTTAYLVCVALGVWAGLLAIRFDRPRRPRAVAIGAIFGAATGALFSMLVF